MKRRIDQNQGVRFFAAALVALVALFTVAACGGGDSTDTTGNDGTNASAPAITKAELIKRADAICRKTDAIQRKAFNAYSKKNELVLSASPEMERVMKNLALPPIGPGIEEIAALGAPPGDEDELAAIITGWEKALKASLDKPSLILSGEGPFAKPDKLAGKYGFKDCAKAL